MTTIILPTSDTTKPRVLYQNVLRDGTVVASSETGINVHENAYDWNPRTFWLPADGAQNLVLTLAVDTQVNSFGLYSHTLWKNGGSIQLFYSLDGSTYVALTGVISPTDSTPIYEFFDPVVARYFKFVVTSTPASYIGCLALGQDMIFERGCWLTFGPPLLSRDTVIMNNVSQGGAFIGRTIIRNGFTTQFDLDFLTESWVRTWWLPFVKAAELHPWFLYWNYSEWPNEKSFCWAEGTIDGATNSQNGTIKRMATSMKFKGNNE